MSSVQEGKEMHEIHGTKNMLVILSFYRTIRFVSLKVKVILHLGWPRQMLSHFMICFMIMIFIIQEFSGRFSLFCMIREHGHMPCD